MVKNIVIKRKSKNLSLKEFHEQNSKVISDEKKVVKINIDERHKFKKQKQVLRNIDINIAHKIEEIKLMPYSHNID